MKKVLFDTSVLVAASISSHKHHKIARGFLQKAISKKIDYFVSSHSLLECYSVLTRIPLQPKLSPAFAIQIINENIKSHAKIVTLSAKQYFQLIEELVDRNLKGGITYDALILASAKFAEVNKVLTFNKKDFLKIRKQGLKL